jgi:hypothetical protein
MMTSRPGRGDEGLGLPDYLFENSLMTLSTLVRQIHDEVGMYIVDHLVAAIRSGERDLTNEFPDAIHNLAVYASKRWNRDDLELTLFKAGSEAHPDNLDLLAGLLQLYYGQHYNPEEAHRTWERIEALPPEKKHPYWRYWVFGAIYYVHMRGDVEKAQEQLRAGITHVNGENKADILRNLSDVFIDRAPEPKMDLVVEELKKGIEEGYQDGHTLALELAKLYRRRYLAGDRDGEGADGEPDAGGGSERERRRRQLHEALDWLEVAEQLFSYTTNHDVTHIYRERVHVLMGLGSYREAIEYIAAIYGHGGPDAQTDPALKAQLILACYRNNEPDRWREITGETLDPSSPEEDEYE